MRRAISDGNLEIIGKQAHAIKGGAANLCAESLSGIANALEKMGKSGSRAECSELLDKLEKEFHRLKRYIRSI